MNLELKYFGYVIGFVFGMCTFELLQDANNVPRFISERLSTIHSYEKTSYEIWLKNKGIVLSEIDQDQLSFSKNSPELSRKLESQLLFNLIHVTCVVFILKAENAYMISNTWGRHCNSLLFYSSSVIKLDYIDLNVIHMKNSWQYLCDCIRHLWITKKRLHWVIFSFDDIYVIPQNLRYFLATKNHSEPHYYGHNVYFWNTLYNSGQTSFVLSKGSIQALVNKFMNESSCEKSGRYKNNEDYFLGKYLTELNITAGSARDHEGKERFHTLKLEILLASDSQKFVEKYSKKSVWPIKLGKDCCSDTTISFPTGGNNLLIHYLIHQAKVFYKGHLGNRHKNETDDPEAWKQTALEEFGSEIDLSKITPSKYYELWEKRINEVESKKFFFF